VLEINDGAIAEGEFVEVDPPHRVVFTWGWRGDRQVPPGSSTVEVTLEPDGDATIVRLIHGDLPEEATEGHAEGWDHFMPRLVTVAGGGNPGPDPWGQ